MSKAAQLKRKAADFEQKRQYDRALPAYVQAIEAASGIPDELDIPLYNRVGDLHLRLGQLDQAVTYYESAVDLYAEGGFFNNAIALCNKVLRHAPGRNVIYYKLGKISARKGFNSDAKQNFLEYAARMEKAGDITEAFRALKEFADLCPGEDDVRLMLAEQLARAGWRDEALDQLQAVYEAMLADDRSTEATATLERIRTLDPTFEPRTGRSRREEKREGLVFIDLDDAEPQGDARPSMDGLPPTSQSSAEGHPLSAEEFAEVELPPPADVHVKRTLDESPLAGLTPLEDPMVTLAADAAAHGDQVSAIERTSSTLSSATDRMHAEPIGVEYTSFDVVSPATIHPEIAEEHVTPAEAPERAWPAEAALKPIVPPEELATETGNPESLADTVTGYLASLSSEVGYIEGGLPDDLAILPPEAVAEEQADASLQSPDARSLDARSDDNFVNLNDWLLETEQSRNPRMTDNDESQGGGSVQTDFSQMLETFKRGVAENVDDTDLDSHYDLGVAYMEMGLLDEAITQFQKVMRGDATSERRVRAYESLGQSFIEKGDYEVAINSLRGAMAEPGLNDAKLVGVLYLLGYASEKLDRWPDAEGYYRRVVAVDIHFRDVGERLKRAQQFR